MEEILLEFLSKTLNIDQSGVAELQQSDESGKDLLTKLLEKDKLRVKQIREKYFNDGHKKGKSESLTEFEKEIAEEYGIDADKKGKELIATIIESKTPKEKETKKDISEDAIKKHPLYISLENRLSKVSEDKDKEWQEKLQAKESEWNQEKTFSTVRDKALEVFSSFNPILSSDPKKAARQKQIIIDELQKYKYDIVGEQIIINKPEGGIYEDEHGNKVMFVDFVKDTASQYFDFQVATPRSSPTDKDKLEGSVTAGKLYSEPTPKSGSEYVNLINKYSKEGNVDAVKQIQADYKAKESGTKS